MTLQASLYAKASAADLERRLTARGIAAGRVRTVAEAMELPHVRTRNVFREAKVPGHDRPLRFVGPGSRFEHDGPGRDGAMREMGAHTDEVLAELGYAAAEITELRAAGVV